MPWLIKRQVKGAALQQLICCNANKHYGKLLALAYLMIKFGNLWSKSSFIS